MRQHLLLAAASLLGAATLPAQAPPPTFELRPYVGASIPTGKQRELFKDAVTTGFQAAVEVTPTFHGVGTFAWTPTQHKYAALDKAADLFQFDVGIEKGLVKSVNDEWEFKPFIGAGVGVRTYRYSINTLSNKTCGLGYGTVGSELQLDKVALRLEARDNVFCYRSPIAGVKSATRNDVGLSFGMAYHFR